MRVRRAQIGGYRLSQRFVCLLCGSSVLRVAIKGHLQQPDVGLSECKRVQARRRQQLLEQEQERHGSAT